MPEPPTTRPEEYVRRALEAAEIADGCYDRKIRQAFFSLAGLRLEQAQAGYAERRALPPDPAADD